MWLPSRCESMLAGRPRPRRSRTGGPELAHPLLRSCPRTRLLCTPRREAANWKHMVAGRPGLRAWAGWWAHTQIHGVTHRLEHKHPCTSIHKCTYTPQTCHLSHTFSQTLANPTPRPTVTHILPQISQSHVPFSLDPDGQAPPLL